MNSLGPRTLKKFLRIAGKKLHGDWILIGGTVLPLLGIQHRATIDIDLIGLDAKKNESLLQLLKLAEELGLPIETMNQAGSYFLEKIPNYRENMILLHKGTQATIYRPNTVLFLLLKIPRLSETDLEDCLQFLEYSKKEVSKDHAIQLRKTLSRELEKTDPGSNRYQRLEKILQTLQRFRV